MTAKSLVPSHRQSAENMLMLYDALPKQGNPIDACGIDFLMRGGWYCASTLDFKLLRSHPEAVRVLSEMKFIRGCRVPIGKQRYTRFICRLLRRRQDVPYGG